MAVSGRTWRPLASRTAPRGCPLLSCLYRPCVGLVTVSPVSTGCPAQGLSGTSHGPRASNPQPAALETAALPVELDPHDSVVCCVLKMTRAARSGFFPVGGSCGDGSTNTWLPQGRPVLDSGARLAIADIEGRHGHIGMPRQHDEQLLSHLDALHPQHGCDPSICTGPVWPALQDAVPHGVVSTPLSRGCQEEVSTKAGHYPDTAVSAAAGSVARLGVEAPILLVEELRCVGSLRIPTSGMPTS